MKALTISRLIKLAKSPSGSIWIQTILILGTLLLGVFQMYVEREQSKKRATLDFVLETARDYREADFAIAGTKNGVLQSISRNRAEEILKSDEETDKIARNLLAEFEWLSVAARNGSISVDTIDNMRGGYIISLHERYFHYMQARINRLSDLERKKRLYENLEWLACKLAKRRDTKIATLNRMASPTISKSKKH